MVLNAHDIFRRHLLSVLLACGFISVFTVSVPVVYMLALPPSVELALFGLLFVACHLANWPMLRLRWRLWIAGALTPYAALCTTALLAGSFGIPLVLLANLLPAVTPRTVAPHGLGRARTAHRTGGEG